MTATGKSAFRGLSVPFGLTDSNRTAAGLADIANTNFIIPTVRHADIAGSQIDPVALAMFQFKLPNGQYMIPSDDGNVPTPTIPDNAYVPGDGGLYRAPGGDQPRLEPQSSDILSLKYYFQDDPTVAPYAYSMVAGFTPDLGRRQPGGFAQQHSNAPAQFQHH